MLNISWPDKKNNWTNTIEAEGENLRTLVDRRVKIKQNKKQKS